MFERERRLMWMAGAENPGKPEETPNTEKPEVEKKQEEKSGSVDAQAEKTKRIEQAALVKYKQIKWRTDDAIKRNETVKKSGNESQSSLTSQYLASQGMKDRMREEITFLDSAECKNALVQPEMKAEMAERRNYLAKVVNDMVAAKQNALKQYAKREVTPRQDEGVYAAFLARVSSEVNVNPDLPNSDAPEQYMRFCSVAKIRFDETKEALAKYEQAKKDRSSLTGDFYDMYKSRMASERTNLVQGLNQWKDGPDREMFEGRINEISRILGPGVWDKFGQETAITGGVAKSLKEEEKKLTPKTTLSIEKEEIANRTVKAIGEKAAEFKKITKVDSNKIQEYAQVIATLFIDALSKAKVNAADAAPLAKAIAERCDSMAGGEIRFYAGSREHSFSFKRDPEKGRVFELLPVDNSRLIQGQYVKNEFATDETIKANAEAKAAGRLYVLKMTDVTYIPKNPTEQTLEQLYAQTQSTLGRDIPDLRSDDESKTLSEQSKDLVDNIKERDQARAANDIARLRAARTEYTAIVRYEEQLKSEGKNIPSRYMLRKGNLTGDIGRLEMKYPNEKPTVAEGSVPVTDRLFMSDGKMRRTPRGPEVQTSKPTNPERTRAALPITEGPMTPEQLQSVSAAASEDLKAAENDPSMLRNIRSFLDAHNVSLNREGDTVKTEMIDDDLLKKFDKQYEDFQKATDDADTMLKSIIEGKNDVDTDATAKALRTSMNTLELSGARYHWTKGDPEFRAKKEQALQTAQTQLELIDAFKATDALLDIARQADVDAGREVLFRKAVNEEGAKVAKIRGQSKETYTRSGRFKRLYEEWDKLPKKDA